MRPVGVDAGRKAGVLYHYVYCNPIVLVLEALGRSRMTVYENG